MCTHNSLSFSWEVQRIKDFRYQTFFDIAVVVNTRVADKEVKAPLRAPQSFSSRSVHS